MAAGKNSYSVDRFTTKQTGGLRIVFEKNAANDFDAPMSALGDNDYITKKMFNQNIPFFPLPLQLTFSAVSTKTINWQTDIPPGQTQTYASLLGNFFPDPKVITGASHAWTQTDRTLTFTTDSTDTLLETVTLDWGFSASGYIQF